MDKNSHTFSILAKIMLYTTMTLLLYNDTIYLILSENDNYNIAKILEMKNSEIV